MATEKIAITLDELLIEKLDKLVEKKVFPNRSRAIQQAVEEKVDRLNRNRLATECAKLDPKFEQAMAEEGFNSEIEEWPEY